MWLLTCLAPCLALLCRTQQIDAMFAADANKLLAGTLMALSAMVHLELPHVNVRDRLLWSLSSRHLQCLTLWCGRLQVLTKCDLVDKEVVEKYVCVCISLSVCVCVRSLLCVPLFTDCCHLTAMSWWQHLMHRLTLGSRSSTRRLAAW